MTAAPPTGRLAGLWADEHVRLVLGIVALAVLYRGVAEVGYSLQFAGPVAGIVWLPVGVGVAFLYLCGLRFWPGVLIGDLLANDYGALPLGAAFGQTAGNLLEVVGITLLLKAVRAAWRPAGVDPRRRSDARRDRCRHDRERDDRLAVAVARAMSSRAERSPASGAPGGSATPRARSSSSRSRSPGRDRRPPAGGVGAASRPR